QLVGVVVEVGLHLVAAGPPRVLAVLRAAAETGLQLRLAAVGDVGEPPGGAQPGVRALPRGGVVVVAAAPARVRADRVQLHRGERDLLGAGRRRGGEQQQRARAV